MLKSWLRRTVDALVGVEGRRTEQGDLFWEDEAPRVGDVFVHDGRPVRAVGREQQYQRVFVYFEPAE